MEKLVFKPFPNFHEEVSKIIKYFSLDLEAAKIAKLSGLNRNTVNRYLKLIRECIAKECELESPFFGAHRNRGKRSI